jgi:hypothetical protein
LNPASFESDLYTILHSKLPLISYKEFRVNVTIEYIYNYKTLSFTSVDLNLNNVSHLCNQLVNSYINNYNSGEPLDTTCDLSYKVTVYKGLTRMAGAVNDNEVPTRSLGGVYKNILHNYIPYLNEGTFNYNFKIESSSNWHRVLVCSKEDNKLLFSFIDHTGLDGLVVRRFGDFSLMFRVVDGVINVVKVERCYPSLKNITKTEPTQKELEVVKFGVLDIETYPETQSDGTVKLMPYAIGVYYEDKYKSFYLTDYENTYYMFKDFFITCK